jgi:oxygen-independent coproporphyrinogen-3 oxidase
MEQNELIKKYNVPVPRYTSYPTVPMWHFDEEVKSKWLILVRKIFEETNEDKGISLYLHPKKPTKEHLQQFSIT